jgi:hypothetical protein
LPSKTKAFLIHFFASAMVVGTVLALIWFAWYPAPLFDLLGAWDLIKVLVGVDLVLGPALTLLLYKPGKPKLLLDMSVVLLIQLGALSYGVAVIYSERPCYMVYTVDRFEAVSCSVVNPADLAANTLLPQKLWYEPLYLVANMPVDPKEMNLLIDEVVFQGKPDIAERPKYWLPFNRDVFQSIKAKRPAMDTYIFEPAEQVVIDRIRAVNDADLLITPLTAKDSSISLILSSETLRPVGSLSVDPWSIELRP